MERTLYIPPYEWVWGLLLEWNGLEISASQRLYIFNSNRSCQVAHESDSIILDSQEKSLSLHPPQYLLLPDFSAFAHVLGVRWTPLLVLICISPVLANIKHLFTGVLAFLASSFRNSLFWSLTHFLWSCLSVLITMWEFWIYSEC